MLGRLIQRTVTPIGVDLGASGAKLMQLRRQRGVWSVVAAARVDPPSEGDEATRRAGFIKALRTRIDAAGFIGRRAILGVDDRHVSVRSVRLPHMSDADTDRALRVDGAARLGLDDEPSEIGWLRAGEVRHGDEIRDELLLMGAPHEGVEHSINLLNEAGLNIVACEPAFVACARAIGWRFKRQSDQKHVRIVLDVGAAATSVMALRGDTLAFYKRLDWGGDRFDNAAAQKLNLDIATVREIRRARISGENARDPATNRVDPLVDRAIYDAVRPLLSELANETTLCMRYYMVTFRGERPESVLLVGGNADEPRLAEIIAEVTGVETATGRPLEGISAAGATFIGGDRRGALAQWATAAGLSLRLEDAARSRATRGVADAEAPAEPAIKREAA